MNETLVEQLVGGARLGEADLVIQLDDWRLRVRSNSEELIRGLRRYFAHILVDSAEQAVDAEVLAIESAPLELDVEFVDWIREPGKTQRKDSVHDFDGGRLVRKVRTGMVFMQSETKRIAAGPCLQNDNQVINFINAQYMNWLQQRDWSICHAAGVVYRDRAFAFAGFSGGGKSTLMLHLLDHAEVDFLTNDRLFVLQQGGGVQARGIPKLPRVNPGTIVHNPKLFPLIAAEKRQRLLDLPQEELWHLEEKHDVMIEDIYGTGRVQHQAPMSGLLILNWDRASDAATTVAAVDLDQRRDLLAAVMKSSGPFYQYRDGRVSMNDVDLYAEGYLSALAGVPVYEARGGVDFDALSKLCLTELMV